MRVIIHMGDTYLNDNPCAKRMRTFYEVFKKHGHDVCILAPYNSNEKSPDVMGYKAISLSSKSSFNRFMNQISSGVNSRKTAKKYGKVDVVITTSPPALLSVFGWKIAKRSKAILIYDVRDIWPDVAWEIGSFSKRSIYSRIFEWNRNFMLKHADMVFAVSRGKVEKLKNYNSNSTVHLVPNGLDEHFLSNVENEILVKKYHLDDVYTCVYFGNIGLAQGLMQLLKVAKRARDNNMPVQFLLFGSGVEEKKLKEYVQAERIECVFFPGRIENEYMYTILKHASMSFVSLVNSNLTDSVPTKMFEALGVGCPVLLAATGEAVDILDGSGLGMSVNPNDEEALWETFCSMYENRHMFESRKEQACQYILENYSRQKIAENMVSIVENAFSSN